MMMVPYMFNEALMDDLFSNDWEHDFDRAMKAAAPRSMFGKRAANVMKTDVRENKDSYDVFVVQLVILGQQQVQTGQRQHRFRCSAGTSRPADF